jgi:hypothetical protein
MLRGREWKSSCGSIRIQDALARLPTPFQLSEEQPGDPTIEQQTQACLLQRSNSPARLDHVRNRRADGWLTCELLLQVLADQYHRRENHFIFDPFVKTQLICQLGNFPVFLLARGLQQVLDCGPD